MRFRILLVLAAVTFLSAATIYAHHSFAANYDTKQEIKIDGKLVQFSLRNPHSFVFIDAADREGKMQRWSLEWSGTAQLAAARVDQQTLKIGDHIQITARPSRVPGEYRGLVVTIKRPSDGWTWGGRQGEAVD